MALVRRSLQIVALLGTLLIGILAFALIVSQTSWFKDWLRHYIVRESKQYLNGDLSIGRLGGNLFFGVEIGDVTVRMNGQNVITLQDAGMDYSVFQLVSGGISLDDIRVNKPVVRLERTAAGWNLASLVKKQAQEADREGPRRPISIGEIGITDGVLLIHDSTPSAAVNTPRQIQKLNAKLAFHYAPVRFTFDVGHLSLHAESPKFDLNDFSGRIAVAGDDVYVQNLEIRTAESQLHVDGVVEHYTGTPTLKLTATSQKLVLSEIGRIVPAAAGIDLQPSFRVSASGPLERLAMKLDLQSSAGAVKGDVIADVFGPARGFQGELNAQHLNLAPLLKDPAQKSDITGDVGFNLRLPATDPLNNVRGTYRFTGPRVAIAGFDVRDVSATGELDGRRVSVDGRAHGYGATATVNGAIVRPAGPAETLSFDLRGSASNVDLDKLPGSLRVPRLDTDLDFTYDVEGHGRAIDADVKLRDSSVEGARIGEGTTAHVSMAGRRLDYAADGTITDLDLQRVGRGLKIAALSEDRFASDIAGAFTVKGSGTGIDRLTLDARGTLRDSAVLGGRVENLKFESHIAQGALHVHADGNFTGFDPATLSGRTNLKGEMNGNLNAEVAIARIGVPIELAAVSGSGIVNLASSSVGGVQIDRAAVNAAYRDQVADVKQLEVAGPLMYATASGRLALDTRNQSNLTFRAQAADLAEVGTLVNQPLGGAALVDGSVKGNGTNLTVEGTLDGSNISSGENQALTVKSRYAATIPDLDAARVTLKATTQAMFLRVGGQALNELRATTTYAQRALDFDATVKQGPRTLDAAGHAVFHPEHQEIHLRNIALATEGARWTTTPGSEAAIQYGKDTVTLKGVSLTSGDQSISADGTIALGDQPSGALDVKAINVDLAQLDRLLLAQQQRMTGRLNASGRLTGSTAQPRFDGTLGVQTATIRGYSFDSFNAKLNYTKASVTLDARLQQTPRQWLTARGTVPLTLFTKTRTAEAEHVTPRPGDEIDLQVESSEIGLAVFQPFITYVTDVQGTLQAMVRITGSGEDPHLQGHVDFKGGAFRVPLGNVAYSGLDTRIELERDKVIIRSFQLLDDHKRALNISGELAAHERTIGAVNVSITSENFELIHNDLGKLDVATNLQITGELRRPRIEGSIELDNGRLEVDKILELINARAADARTFGETPADAPTATGTQNLALDGSKPAAAGLPAEGTAPAATVQPAAAAQETGLFDELALDVRLRFPNNLVVRGKDIRGNADAPIGLGNLNVTVGGDVSIRKRPGQPPFLLGTVNTIRGTYDFQGRRFDIQRDGRIQFRGETEMNPALDLTAIRIISGVEARVRVRGTVRAPELVLSSNPPLEEADILSLIVFNKPINSLDEGEKISIGERAGALAAGFVASPLAESIGEALDVDLFEIEATNTSGQLGPRVTLGQQLGQRLFVKFSQGFGQDDASQFTLEYQIADYLRLQTSVAQGGSVNRSLTRRVERGGIDLIFFFSY